MGHDEWREVSLGDVLKIKHGWPFKSDLFSEELAGRPIVVSIGNYRYTGGFRFDSTATKEYRGSYPKEFELAPGDILLVMTCQTEGGEILGIPARIPNDDRIYLHNQRLGKVVVTRPDLVSADFLYWVFLWKDFNQELVATASGTKIVHTAPTRIEAFRFALPPLNEQQKIARILGALDDKIELNRRMNHTLEEMARAIFQSWFVDFDPVTAKSEGRQPYGMNAETAALVPSALEDSSIGEVPRGWKVGSILDFADLLSGGTPKTSIAEYWDGGISWVSAKDASSASDLLLLSTEKTVSQAGLENSATKLLPKYTTIVTARGTVGAYCLLSREMAMNQTNYGLKAKEGIGDYFVFFSLMALVEQLRQHAYGTIFDTITTKTFRDTYCIQPTQKLIGCFEQTVSPFMNAILTNLEQSRTLAAIRAALLPKLLSGEIRVKDATDFQRISG